MSAAPGLLRRVWHALRGLVGAPGDGRADTGGVDVVVPVHDARADVERCLRSVLRHAAGDVRVVVVDDASRDAGLVAWLDDLAARENRVVLLRNPRNVGFVKSANRGMAAGPGRDVLLLNSDTEVPAGSLERLRAAAHHDARTGIVSPFTNDGTILSLPEWMVANPLPAGLDVAAFDALVAGTSARARPEIVTAHGFCMYLRRAVLDRVGLFDEAFGRGYGEENDLCERAKAAGFAIRACDDLFVWHRGSASFSGEVDALKTANLAVLGARHPRYHDDVQAFVRANPLGDAQESVRYQLARRERRRAPAMLFVLHADPFTDPRTTAVGGTELHVLDLLRALALPRAVVTWPGADGMHAAEIAHGALAGRVPHLFPRSEGGAATADERFALADPARERAFASLVEALDVGAAHLHHLAGWPARIWRVLAERGVPFAFTTHDYLSTCPSFYRLDLTTCRTCACLEGPASDAERCLAAFHDACGIAPAADPLARIRAQRTEHAALLAAAGAVVAPSEVARGIVARAFPDVAPRWHVIPHALPVTPATAARAPRAGDAVLRVALLGAPSAPWKGADLVLAAMRATRGTPLAWHVFGDAGAHGFPQRVAEALGDGTTHLQVHGRYVREEIVSLLQRAAIDVTLIASPWPETFSYTLSESWAAGVPAIVLDGGAPAARVRASGAGIVARDVAEVVAALEQLARDPALLDALAGAARAAAAHEPTLAENAARHRTAYGDALARLAPRATDPPWGARDRALFLAHRAALGVR